MIGVVNAGGHVEMQDWEPKMKGLLWGWYGGQETGTAMAEVLFESTTLREKLPVTFEKDGRIIPVTTAIMIMGPNK